VVVRKSVDLGGLILAFGVALVLVLVFKLLIGSGGSSE